MDRGRRTRGVAAAHARSGPRVGDSALIRARSIRVGSGAGRCRGDFHRKNGDSERFSPFFALTLHLETALVARHGTAMNHLSNHIQGFLRHEQRSEEHTSELQSLMRISYAVFCLKK